MLSKRLVVQILALGVISVAQLAASEPAPARGASLQCGICRQADECPDQWTRDHDCASICQLPYAAACDDEGGCAAGDTAWWCS